MEDIFNESENSNGILRVFLSPLQGYVLEPPAGKLVLLFDIQNQKGE